MKKIICGFILLFSLFSLNAFASENYTLDPNHSYVAWKVSHFGFSSPSGKWLANGTLVLDEANPENSKLNVTIDVANIVTGIPKFDEHLKSKDFFEVEKFPKATFVSDKIDVTGKKSARVHGMLTLHGVTKPITLNVTLNKIDVNPIDHKKSAGFSATAEIQRSAFGISSYIPGVADDVKLEIEAEAKLNGNA